MANLKDVERRARELMTRHGVGHLEFKFDGGKRRMGATQFVKPPGSPWLAKQISLSRHFAALLPLEEIENTILHEIAHALAGKEAGHGPLWRMKARSLGIAPNRCGTASAKPEQSVVGHCDECGTIAAKQHRLPLRVYRHAKCKSVLTWSKNGTRLSISQMPERYRAEYNRALARGVI